jgi:hypothetical protein
MQKKKACILFNTKGTSTILVFKIRKIATSARETKLKLVKLGNVHTDKKTGFLG